MSMTEQQYSPSQLQSQFPDHNSQSSEDKRRVARRACLNCRKKKIKCDGESQSDARCTRCRNLNLPCEFIASNRGGRRKKRLREDGDPNMKDTDSRSSNSTEYQETPLRAKISDNNHNPNNTNTTGTTNSFLSTRPDSISASSSFPLFPGRGTSLLNQQNLDNLDTLSSYSSSIDTFNNRNEFASLKLRQQQMLNNSTNNQSANELNDEKVKQLVDSRLQERFFDGPNGPGGDGPPFMPPPPPRHHRFRRHHGPPMFFDGMHHHGPPPHHHRGPPPFGFGHHPHHGPPPPPPPPPPFDEPGPRGGPRDCEDRRFPYPPPFGYPYNNFRRGDGYDQSTYSSSTTTNNVDYSAGVSSPSHSNVSDNSITNGDKLPSILSLESTVLPPIHNKSMEFLGNSSGSITAKNSVIKSSVKEDTEIITISEPSSSNLVSLWFNPRIISLFDLPPISIIEKLIDLFYLYVNPIFNVLPNSKGCFLIDKLNCGAFPERLSYVFSIFTMSCIYLKKEENVDYQEEFSDPDYWFRLVEKYWKFQSHDTQLVLATLNILSCVNVYNCFIGGEKSSKSNEFSYNFLKTLTQASKVEKFTSLNLPRIFDTATSTEDVLRPMYRVNTIWSLWMNQSFYKLVISSNFSPNVKFPSIMKDEIEFPKDLFLPIPSLAMVGFVKKVIAEKGGFSSFKKLDINEKRRFVFNEFESKSQLIYYDDLKERLQEQMIIPSSAILIMLLKIHEDLLSNNQKREGLVDQIKVLEAIYFKDNSIYNIIVNNNKNGNSSFTKNNSSAFLVINSYFLQSKLVLLNSKTVISNLTNPQLPNEDLLAIKLRLIFKLLKKKKFLPSVSDNNDGSNASLSVINQKLYILKSQILPKIPNHNQISTNLHSNLFGNQDTFFELLELAIAGYELGELLELGQGKIFDNEHNQKQAGYKSIIALDEAKAIGTMTTSINEIPDGLLTGKFLKNYFDTNNSKPLCAKCWLQFPLISDALVFKYGLIICSILLLNNNWLIDIIDDSVIELRLKGESETKLVTVNLDEMDNNKTKKTIINGKILIEKIFNQTRLQNLLSLFVSFLKFRFENICNSSILKEYYYLLNEIKQYCFGVVNTDLSLMEIMDEDDW